MPHSSRRLISPSCFIFLVATSFFLLSSSSSSISSSSPLTPAAAQNQTDASCAALSGNDCDRCEIEFCAYCLDGNGACQLATAPCASSYIYYGQTCPDNRGQVHGLSQRDSIIIGLSVGLGVPLFIALVFACVWVCTKWRD